MLTLALLLAMPPMAANETAADPLAGIAMRSPLCSLSSSAQGEGPSQGTADRPPAEPMPVPVGMARALGDRRIQIDGSLEDWPSTSPILLLDSRQISGTGYRGPSDVSAQLFLVWDAEDLYVAAKVRDDWHRPLGARVFGVGEIPPADNILLTFDPRRDTRALGRDLGRQEDREFWLAQVDGEGQKRVVLWDRFRGQARWAEGARLEVARDEKLGVTTYEARLPWREVLPPGTQPGLDPVLDVQIVVNDLDEVTDIMPQTRIGWTFGTGPRIDPGLFGSVFLLGDEEGPEVKLPELPPRRRQAEDPVPGPRYWVGLWDELRALPPRIHDPGESGDPRASLSDARRRALATLEGHLAGFPRVDFLELQYRIHRRMRREAAGMAATGLPYFWDHALADVRRRSELPPPERGLRLFRLPQGGWLVVSKAARFAIDPSGYGLEQLFYDQLDFVLLTDPLDPCKRNDQLLVRMIGTGRPFLTHIGFHLPLVDIGKLDLAEPGQQYEHKTLRVIAVGDRDEKGRVPTSIGYHILWPDGTSLLHAGRFARPDQLPPEARRVDVLLLSAEHATPQLVAQRTAAALTVLDDVLQCARRPGPDGRVTLEAAFDLQADFRPHRSLILAPGESIDLP